MICLINKGIHGSYLPPTLVNPNGFADFALYIFFYAVLRQ